MLTIQNKERLINSIIANGPYYVSGIKETYTMEFGSNKLKSYYSIELTNRQNVLVLTLDRNKNKEGLYELKYNQYKILFEADFIKNMNMLVYKIGILLNNKVQWQKI